jgi:hypothetical protein
LISFLWSPFLKWPRADRVGHTASNSSVCQSQRIRASRCTPCSGSPRHLSQIRVYVSLPRTCHSIYMQEYVGCRKIPALPELETPAIITVAERAADTELLQCTRYKSPSTLFRRKHKIYPQTWERARTFHRATHKNTWA